jgi:hypothetical protein
MLSIPVRAIPYWEYASRLLIGKRSLEAIATKVEILSPEERDCSCEPAVFLATQPAKIKSAMIPGQTVSEALASATAATVTHLPTLAYQIDDAVLIDGAIYSERHKYWIAHRKGSPKQVLDLHFAAVASTPQGARWFGHWLMDDCLTYEIARNFDNVICVNSQFSGQQKQYQAYFGQDWTELGSARIKHLTIFEDYGHNHYKRQRQRQLSHAIQQRFPFEKPTRVYLRRGATGTPRPIANEQQIIQTLTKHGFIVADIENDSLEELLSVLCSAEIVVSLEGSHVAHCCFSLPRNVKLLLLQPNDRFCMIHNGWLGCIEAIQGFVVGEKTVSGYFFPTSDILKTIDLMYKYK